MGKEQSRIHNECTLTIAGVTTENSSVMCLVNKLPTYLQLAVSQVVYCSYLVIWQILQMTIKAALFVYL